MPNCWRTTAKFIGDSFVWFAWLLLTDGNVFLKCLPEDLRDEIHEEQPSKPHVSLAAKVLGYGWKMVYNLLASTLTVFIGYLILFHPYSMRPRLDNATIVAFDLMNTTSSKTTAAALRYELSPNITFFNEHRIFAIRFNHLTAGLYFHDTKIGPSDDTLPRFKLHTRRHKRVHPVLRGRASNVSAAVAEEFARELAAGTFTVDIRLKTTMTYIYWPTRAVYYYVYNCWLHFPAPPNNNRTAVVVTRSFRCRSSKSK